jgi:hypothetical protein
MPIFEVLHEQIKVVGIYCRSDLLSYCRQLTDVNIKERKSGLLV